MTLIKNDSEKLFTNTILFCFGFLAFVNLQARSAVAVAVTE